MIKKALKPSAILVAVLMLITQVSFSLPAVAAGSASLSFGDATLRNGCPGSITINLDTGGDSVWAADVAMLVSGGTTVDSLELGSILPYQSCNDPLTPEIMLCGARQPGTNAFSGQGIYGTINLTPASAGSLSLSFNSSSTNIINDSILDILGNTTGASYTVAERLNIEVDGTGFCDPDITAPAIVVSPQNGKNNVPLDTSISLTLSDNRVGVDLSTLAFSVNGTAVDTSTFTKTGGTYTPTVPFALGEQVSITASVCDLESNCRNYSGSFRTTPPPPPPDCGDGNVSADEECDEKRQTATCDRDCTFVECGDGIINDIAGEECDDLNQENGDGCTSLCTVETPVEDATYCPSPKEVEAPECPVIEEVVEEEAEEEPEIVEEEEGEIEAPEPEIDYSEEEIEEKAVKVFNEEKTSEKAPGSIKVPEQKEVNTRIEECKLAFPDLDFNYDSTDTDHDGLSNKTECYALTDPVLPDTDGDGCIDGDEINQYASDPLNGFDCKIEDKNKAITISSPQAGWLLAQLDITGLTPEDTSLIHLLAFPESKKTPGAVKVDEIEAEGTLLGTIRRFNPSDIEGQFHFKHSSDVQLEDNQSYSLVAIGVLKSGETISSSPIQITMDPQNAANAPSPTSIGDIPITDDIAMKRIKIKAQNDGKVRVTGRTEYGSQVFATWESIVLASSVIADSELGEFSIESPRALTIGEDHEVTLFALKKAGNQQLKSKNVDIRFHIKKPNIWPLIVTALTLILLAIITMYRIRINKYKALRKHRKH